MTEVAIDRRRRIREALADGGGGVLEILAAKLGVSLAEILDELGDDQAIAVDGAKFAGIWQRLTQWGEVLLIVHTPDIVLECTGALPPGSEAQGYFNIHGESPISGHIKTSNCRSIYFVDRLFHGRRSCSLQFLNGKGEAMFKVFVRRDAARNLVADQLKLFEQLRDVYRK